VSIVRGRGANLALSLASVAVTALVLAGAYELVAQVRYLRWRASFDNRGWMGKLTVASANPVLLWEYRPHAEASGIVTNRHGFRDVDYPTPEKPAGIRRVAFLGDSVTLGMGVSFPETFVARVGARSREEGQALQALNFGVDGYNALQIRELLTARVLAFEPDQVVYVMSLNDFDFTDSSGRKIAYFRRPSCFLLQDLERRWRSLRGVEFYRYHFERNREAAFGAVGEMKEILEAREKALFIFLVPVFPDPPDDPSYFDHYPLRELHRDIRREADTRGLHIHDLLPAFRGDRPRPPRYSLDVWHLNEEGHRVVAEAILAVLSGPAARGHRPLHQST
jgi:lysophospholipase L1-like esterase